MTAESKESWLDVRHYGAVGNCDADDTDAVQAAMNSGSATIRFSAGTYSLREVNIPATVKAISGHGATIKQRIVGVNTFTLTSSEGIVFHDLRFEGAGSPGDRPAGGNTAIHAASCRRISVTRCFFSRYRLHAVHLVSCSDCQILDNELFQVSNGIRLTGCQTVKITGNTIDESLNAPEDFAVAIGLDSTDGHAHGRCVNIVISNNVVKHYVNAQAVLVHAGSRIVISGNVFEDVLIGVSVNPFNVTDLIQFVAICGNVYEGTSKAGATAGTGNDGIVVQGGPSSAGGITPSPETITVSGNSIYGANQVVQATGIAGIRIGYSKNVTISGNSLRGCRLTGIRIGAGSSLEDEDRVLCSNNIIDNTVLISNQQVGIDAAGHIQSLISGNIISDHSHGVGLLLRGPDNQCVHQGNRFINCREDVKNE